MPWWLELALSVGSVTAALLLGALWWSTQRALKQLREQLDEDDTGIPL